MATSTTNPFETDLDRRAANFRPLTPIDFLVRAAQAHKNKRAIVYGDQSFTYGEMFERCNRLTSSLRARGIGKGDTVSIMCPNIPPMLEAHYGVPMAGAVLNALNIRLDPATIAFILEHAGTRILFTDTGFAPTIKQALSLLARNRPDQQIMVIDIIDPNEPGEQLGDIDYEQFLANGQPDQPVQLPDDEWQSMSLCYTSGTTGNPKGAVYHHRGAYLNAIGNALVMRLGYASAYLWTLPMFHCNGWTFTWGTTAVAATHVCLRRVEPAGIFKQIETAGVTHMCGAPIVLNMLAHSPEAATVRLPRTVEIGTGGAAPPSAVIAAMENMGFHVTHLYGLTETYGPATICTEEPAWLDQPLDQRARLVARQGVNYPTMGDMMVADPQTMQPVPNDAETIGEIMLRGNTVMKGYLKNPEATNAAFSGEWYHTGDLAVSHGDGYVEVKDRSKDVIISGGENISSLEVEEVLFRHPDIIEAAVVAAPSERWGETPCAFVLTKPDAGLDEQQIKQFARDNLAGFKVPGHVVFAELPKTSTGKIKKYELRDEAQRLFGTDN